MRVGALSIKVLDILQLSGHVIWSSELGIFLFAFLKYDVTKLGY